MRTGWLALLSLVALGSISTQAATVSGQLTGDWKAWNHPSVEARTSRDFAIPPVATSGVDDEGGFSFEVPDTIDNAYITILPKRDRVHPVLLNALPVAMVSPVVLAVSKPAFQRQDRQSIGASKYWISSVVLLLLLVMISRWLRRWLAGHLNSVSRDTPRWEPSLKDNPAPKTLAFLLSLVGGLLLYGIVALDESMDLLEYTYFQEAFSGSNPFSVAISAVVAERAHAPGFSVLLWFFTQFTDAAMWLRLPACLAAIGCVWVVHRMCNQVTGNRLAAALAGLLAGLAPLAMRYGRDLSPYSLAALLTVASTWLLIRALSTGDRRDWVAFTWVSVGAFFLHYFAAVFLLGQFIAVVWLWQGSGRTVAWTKRFHSAIFWFAMVGVLPALWAPQVLRGFEVSMHDTMVTGTVYGASSGFVTYLTQHLRVLMGLPIEIAWATWPAVLLVGGSFVVLIRKHPVLGRLLLMPLLLVVGLIALTYGLQAMAYGGRTYYGFRWLRAFTPAIAIPVGYSAAIALQAAKTQKKPISVLLAILLTMWVGSTAFAGIRSALSWERPAQREALHTILDNAQSGDAIAVMPAGFYSVQISYYLHQSGPRQSIHEGPPMWDHYTKPNGDDVVLYGPIRSYGIPLESVARHVDVNRLWLVVFRESVFGQAEFDTNIGDHVVANLARDAFPHPWYRMKTWTLPLLDLILFERNPDQKTAGGAGTDPTDPWFQKHKNCKANICVPIQDPYRFTRWAPSGLDPSGLTALVDSTDPLELRFPTPTGTHFVTLSVKGAPEDAAPDAVTIKGVSLTFNKGQWTGKMRVFRAQPTFNVILQRAPKMRSEPLILELTR
jgi:hypothetical protein